MTKSAFVLAILALVSTGSALASPNGWNGRWVLSQTRNPEAIKKQAAEDYDFTLGEDGSITWRIPSLNEIVAGHTDGQRMQINRPGVKGLTLAVTAEGPYVLLYKVARDGTPVGEGRMTLVENGTAWVDISGPAGKPQYTGAVIYVRPEAGAGKTAPAK